MNNQLLNDFVVPVHQWADERAGIVIVMQLFDVQGTQLASLSLSQWQHGLDIVLPMLDRDLPGLLAMVRQHGGPQPKDVVHIRIKTSLFKTPTVDDYSKIGTGRSAFWAPGMRRNTNKDAVGLVIWCTKNNMRLDVAIKHLRSHCPILRNHWSRNLSSADAAALVHYAKINNMPQELWATI